MTPNVLAEAVRKMTSLPAEHFGLRERGVLAKGHYADVIVFDPGTLRDRATYSEPHQLSEGVIHMLVNGRVTIRDGSLTGERHGIWL